MALSQQHPSYDNMPLPAPPSRTGSNEENPGYPSSQQSNAPGSYGQYGFQGQQQGAYATPNDPGWIQRVLEEMKDMLVLLSAEGRINYASPSAKQITGRSAKQFEGTFLTQYIHDDDKHIFIRDMAESVTSNQPFRTHVRFSKTNSTHGLVEIYGHPHIASQNPSQGRNESSEDRCAGFFLVCRPYPNKTSLLLDSFLEHKIENARLVQQIAKLKQEEEEEATITRMPYGKLDEDKSYSENPPATNQVVLSDQESTETVAPNSDSSDENPTVDFYSDDPPRRPQNFSHIDGIEVMTGLYYGDGERSHGLSTGLNRGRLVHCDIDITTAADQARNAQEGDRRKRLKGQHVCGDCGTADSPEWRKGPGGPKTLCNACGLRWSKKEKKRQDST